MDFHIYGTQGQPTLLLLPGLGVSHEIFHHGQLLIDHPDEVAKRIIELL